MSNETFSLGSQAKTGVMICDTLKYTTLDPPPSGTGVENPMTADLDANGFNINNCPNVLTNPLQADLDGNASNSIINVESYNGTTLVDVEPTPDTNTIYKEQVITGAGWKQSVPVGIQEDFSTIGVNFPTSQPLWWCNKLPLNAMQCVIGRRAGLNNLVPGYSVNQLNIGSQVSFKDRCLYDPLNLRYAPVPPHTTYTACRFGDNCVGFQGIGSPINAIVYVHAHLEGSFQGSNQNNECRVFIRQYDNAGNPVQDYQLMLEGGKTSTGIVSSADRCIMGFTPYETINGGDYFEIFFENFASSVNNFDISLIKTIIEVRPCP